jgi:hypothetical protein
MRTFRRARAFTGFNENDIPPKKQLAYVCGWLDKMARNKRFMARNLAALDDRDLVNYPMLSEVGGFEGGLKVYPSENFRIGDWSYRSYQECKDNLAKYKRERANFAVIRLFKAADIYAPLDTRMFVLKLDQSSTGGWLNASYPCAMFDPHVGQGMYSDHAILAFDLCDLMRHYNRFCLSYTFLLQASGID